MASSNGSANVAPSPRSIVRRGIDRRVRKDMFDLVLFTLLRARFPVRVHVRVRPGQHRTAGADSKAMAVATRDPRTRSKAELETSPCNRGTRHSGTSNSEFRTPNAEPQTPNPRTPELQTS